MKICIYGAGAVGGLIAGRLAQAGHEVSVVARGAHLMAIRERLLKRWPNLEQRLQRIERKGPTNWQEMLDECDLLIHEERQNAIAHERLHSDEIVTIERTIDHWDTAERVQRFSVYMFLVWLKKQHHVDRSIEAILHEAAEHAANSTPPTS